MQIDTGHAGCEEGGREGGCVRTEEDGSGRIRQQRSVMKWNVRFVCSSLRFASVGV